MEIKEDYKIFTIGLKCPNCGAKCDDEQRDSREEFKEDYCVSCDGEFGYEERIVSQFGQEKERYYRTYKI